MVIEDGKYPNSLEEAIGIIVNQITPDERTYIQSVESFDFIVVAHHTLGQEIRNKWMLWYNQPENKLTDELTTLGLYHGDDRSGLILNCVYRKVNDQPYDIEGAVERCRIHWDENGGQPAIPGPYVPQPGASEHPPANEIDNGDEEAIVSMNAVAACIQEAKKYGLHIETIVWALLAMKRDPSLKVSEAINHGLNEWVK